MQVIHVEGITVLEAEDNAPVAADADGPEAFSVAMQRMEIRTGKAHVADVHSGIELRQHKAQPLGVLRADTGLAPGLEEILQPLVTEALNHTLASWRPR
jgi:hypothetical protein